MNQRSPRNTTTDVTDNPLGILAAASGPGGVGQAIEEQERSGQAQLLASTTLPTEGSQDPRLLELGFAFGDQVEGDPLFRAATLPDGWKREAGEDGRQTYIVDERGIRRVSVFYKAAYYDRRADIHLMSVGYSAATSAIYGDDEFPTLHPQLTADELADTRARAESYIEQAKDPVTGHIYADRVDRAKYLLRLIEAHPAGAAA